VEQGHRDKQYRKKDRSREECGDDGTGIIGLLIVIIIIVVSF
jgi:hypothetical protein